MPRSSWQCAEKITLLRAAHVGAQPGEQVGDLVGRGVADGVGRVEGDGTGLDHRREDLGQEVALGAQRILGGEFDVVAQLAGAAHGLDGGVDDLLPAHAQLVLAVQRAGRQEQVDAARSRRLDGTRRGLDVARQAARQAAHGGVSSCRAISCHRGEVVRRGLRETGLDDVDAEILQGLRQAQLLRSVHGEAGRLLAVAQAGVEYAYPVVDRVRGRARGFRLGGLVGHLRLRWRGRRATKNPASFEGCGVSGVRMWLLEPWTRALNPHLRW